MNFLFYSTRISYQSLGREREREREILVIFRFLKYKGIITIATLVLTIMTTSMFDYQIIKLLKSIVNVNKFDYGIMLFFKKFL